MNVSNLGLVYTKRNMLVHTGIYTPWCRLVHPLVHETVSLVRVNVSISSSTILICTKNISVHTSRVYAGQLVHNMLVFTRICTSLEWTDTPCTNDPEWFQVARISPSLFPVGLLVPDVFLWWLLWLQYNFVWGFFFVSWRKSHSFSAAWHSVSTREFSIWSSTTFPR